MPVTGGIEAPVILPLKAFSENEVGGSIDTSTYIEIKSNTPNARLYFTTDGSKPNPWTKKKASRNEQTFMYKAPFSLHTGRRVVRAIAVNRKFNVTSLDGYGGSGSERRQTDSSGSDLESSFKPNKPVFGSLHRPHTGQQSMRFQPQRIGGISDESTNGLYEKNADQGFAATNHSGTQINLWGHVPGLNWDVRTPNAANLCGTYAPGVNNIGQQTYQSLNGMGLETNVTPQQLTAIANHLKQCIDQTRHMTVAEVRELLNQVTKPGQSTLMNGYEEKQPLLAISDGRGDLKRQLNHISRHLEEYARHDSFISESVSAARLGKVMAVDFDEDDTSFLLTVQLEKPENIRKGIRASSMRSRLNKVSNENQKPTESGQMKPKPMNVDGKGKITKQSDNTKSEPTDNKADKSKSEQTAEPYYTTEEVEYSPTLKPYPNFDKNTDCERLRKAMKGLGTDEKTIIEIMGHRSSDQRSQLVTQFKTMYGKDLISEFKSELSGNFYECIEFLCYSLVELDATILYKAVKGLGTDEDALIEILSSRTNQQIKQIKEAYRRLYAKDLEKDIQSDTSQNFRKILISLLQANRDESLTVNRNEARQDAQTLYESGEKKMGTDESQFNMILASRSYAHLRAVFEEYMSISKRDIEDALKAEMSGDILRCMLAIVRCIRNPQKYFAQLLMKSMKGLGTKDSVLIRIIVTRCEVDLGKIKEEFQREAGKTLESWVVDDTSGDYQRILLTLISG